jgi:hypothetical protein
MTQEAGAFSAVAYRRTAPGPVQPAGPWALACLVREDMKGSLCRSRGPAVPGCSEAIESSALVAPGDGAANSLTRVERGTAGETTADLRSEGAEANVPPEVERAGPSSPAPPPAVTSGPAYASHGQPEFWSVDVAATRLSLTAGALRARCRRAARREGRNVIAHLGGGVVAHKFGRSWRVRFSPTTT